MRKVPAPIHVSATKAHLEQELEITAEGRDERIWDRQGPNLAEAIQSFVVQKQGRQKAPGPRRDKRVTTETKKQGSSTRHRGKRRVSGESERSQA
jgi:hypothetical protein